MWIIYLWGWGCFAFQNTSQCWMNCLDITDPVMPYRNSKMTSAVRFQADNSFHLILNSCQILSIHKQLVLQSQFSGQGGSHNFTSGNQAKPELRVWPAAFQSSSSSWQWWSHHLTACSKSCIFRRTWLMTQSLTSLLFKNIIGPEAF